MQYSHLTALNPLSIKDSTVTKTFLLWFSHEPRYHIKDSILMYLITCDAVTDPAIISEIAQSRGDKAPAVHVHGTPRQWGRSRPWIVQEKDRMLSYMKWVLLFVWKWVKGIWCCWRGLARGSAFTLHKKQLLSCGLLVHVKHFAFKLSGKSLEGAAVFLKKYFFFHFWGHLLVTLLKKKFTVVFRTKKKHSPAPSRIFRST